MMIYLLKNLIWYKEKQLVMSIEGSLLTIPEISNPRC